MRVIRKWGWCSETYYLLFAHMFTRSEYFHDDMDYLNYNGYPLHKGLMDNKEEADKLLDSMALFLTEIAYDTEDEELSTLASGMLGELARAHIFPEHPVSPEDEEKAETLKNRYGEVVEKVRNAAAMEEVRLTEEANNANAADIAVLYPEDDDIPEI